MYTCIYIYISYIYRCVCMYINIHTERERELYVYTHMCRCIYTYACTCSCMCVETHETTNAQRCGSSACSRTSPPATSSAPVLTWGFDYSFTNYDFRKTLDQKRTHIHIYIYIYICIARGVNIDIGF